MGSGLLGGGDYSGGGMSIGFGILRFNGKAFLS